MLRSHQSKPEPPCIMTDFLFLDKRKRILGVRIHKSHKLLLTLLTAGLAPETVCKYRGQHHHRAHAYEDGQNL